MGDKCNINLFDIDMEVVSSGYVYTNTYMYDHSHVKAQIFLYICWFMFPAMEWACWLTQPEPSKTSGCLPGVLPRLGRRKRARVNNNGCMVSMSLFTCIITHHVYNMHASSVQQDDVPKDHTRCRSPRRQRQGQRSSRMIGCCSLRTSAASAASI